jgi:acyl-CoA synthetase (AMP-forming)/AMP-acid ligase II
VNRHLAASATDTWLCVLPLFHVGGLSIGARAYLAGAKAFIEPWDIKTFDKIIREKKVKVNGQRVDASYKVDDSSQVEVFTDLNKRFENHKAKPKISEEKTANAVTAIVN